MEQRSDEPVLRGVDITLSPDVSVVDTVSSTPLGCPNSVSPLDIEIECNRKE